MIHICIYIYIYIHNALRQAQSHGGHDRQRRQNQRSRAGLHDMELRMLYGGFYIVRVMKCHSEVCFCYGPVVSSLQAAALVWAGKGIQ